MSSPGMGPIWLANSRSTVLVILASPEFQSLCVELELGLSGMGGDLWFLKTARITKLVKICDVCVGVEFLEP